MNPLAKLRAEIDAIDQQLVELIVNRFAIADRVIAVKQAQGIAAALPDRIEQVMANVIRHGKTSNIPPHTIEKLWRCLIAETIAYEEKRLGSLP